MFISTIHQGIDCFSFLDEQLNISGEIWRKSPLCLNDWKAGVYTVRAPKLWQFRHTRLQFSSVLREIKRNWEIFNIDQVRKVISVKWAKKRDFENLEYTRLSSDHDDMWQNTRKGPLFLIGRAELGDWEVELCFRLATKSKWTLSRKSSRKNWQLLSSRIAWILRVQKKQMWKTDPPWSFSIDSTLCRKFYT